MENCSVNLSTHQGMGTTQEERFLTALRVNHFLIDERKDIDYIEFVQKLSPFIKFYNESNIESGNWSAFFQWESTSILVSIFLWDIDKIQQDYKIVKEQIKNIQKPQSSTENDIHKNLLNDFFQKIKTQFEAFNNKIELLDESITAKNFLLDTSYLVVNNFQQGVLEEILLNINDSNITNPIRSLISKYQFDKNFQKLIGLLFNWKQISGESIENQFKNYAKHTPHYSLFLAFLKLLGVAQDHLNEFTKKHLDFYYKDILDINHANAIPDYVHLLLESVEQNKGLFLPNNSIFAAGKNELGKNKFYASTSELALNNVKLKYFNSAFFSDLGIRNQSEFMKINGTNKSFNIFEDESTLTETGILIASSLFYLNGGDRYIIINIEGIDIDTSEHRFFITGEKKLIEIVNFDTPPNSIESKEDSRKNKRLYLLIPSKEKAIIGYDAEIHKEIKVATNFPVLKIVPKNENDKIENFTNLTIEVKVRNLKNFVLATDNGTVDISKPFSPFGEFPKSGNGYVICCNEFFVKDQAKLFIKTNNSDSVKILKLDGGIWNESDENESISNGIVNTNPILEYELENKIPEKESVSGYVRIVLNDTSYNDGKFLNDFINEIKKTGTSTLRQAPVINSIFLDYDVVSKTCGKNKIEIFQITPFGYKHIKETNNYNNFNSISSVSQSKRASVNQCEFIPVDKLLTTGGEIYLGFENVEVGNSLNVLFQLSEGSANPLRDPAILKWYFLENENTWMQITNDKIGDETNGLIQSGLIHYTVPNFDTSKTTILPAGNFWIKVEVDETDAICEFIGVHDHAFKAVLTDFENNGSQFTEHTASETITKLYEPLNFIKKVVQPYSSFGGKVKENDNLLYQRTSERLRHKFRAITLWDYERLILQEFPNVFRVKCLNHYRYDANPVSKISAGYITLIPIAKSNTTQEIISWKPLVSQGTMNRIKTFISQIASPHARIIVKQPKLETIQLTFSVKYHELVGADMRLYDTKLKNTINKYLSPWSFGSNEIQFANSIEIASMIQLIDNQPFVDFITDFEVIHRYIDENSKLVKLSNIKDIIPSTDYTLFVPPTLFTLPIKDRNQVKEIDHKITMLTDNDNC